MSGTREVRLGSTLVGALTNLPGDYNVFAFDEAYREDPARPVLSQSLITVSGAPIERVPRTHTIAPPFFSNLLPEEGSVLRALIGRQYRINQARDFWYLDALGSDLPGAVIVTGDDAREAVAAEATESTAPERPIRFSLAGVQIKFSGSMIADRLTIPLAGRGGSWIVKLPTNQYARLPENEHAMMEFARRIGMSVPRTALIPLDHIEGLPLDLPSLRSDEPRVAYAIERFDRKPDGERVHCEDLNQIANQPPREKYEHKATHWVANVIATLCPGEDVDEFVRRLVFGICIGNDDMHLKNWAILYIDGRNARIAPLYDFACTRLYYPAGPLALTIGGEREFERIDYETMTRLARAAEISARRTRNIARETVEAIREVWSSYKADVADNALRQAVERQFRRVPLMH